MVIHEAKCVDKNSLLGHYFGQTLKKLIAVAIIKKDLLAIITADPDMIKRSIKFNARLANHSLKIKHLRRFVKVFKYGTLRQVTYETKE